MASLRDIRTRIASVKSTRQITSAMKMVAAAKLRRATEAATNARPYQETLTATIGRVASGAGDIEHPLLTTRAAVKKVVLVVVGTDRGLCAGFNSNRDRKVEELVRSLRAEGKTVTVRSFGKKPRDFLKARGVDSQNENGVVAAKYAATVAALSESLTTGFEAGEFDEAWLCYNKFKSTLTQVPTFTRILPLSIEKSEGAAADFKYEPDGKNIMGTLLPLYLRTLLLQAFLENEAGEHASRMTAMDSATRNASDLIDRLTLEYNRSRQAAITKELIEIISGAEAL
ncbi:MAG: ATP synthase F1 subunit gamma [Deltaproteobacteria bacterium]|nr:ATP synthase F1 subunit gamma [Deltaproteobacteria bacterium]